jgi:hypothetical protein
MKKIISTRAVRVFNTKILSTKRGPLRRLNSRIKEPVAKMSSGVTDTRLSDDIGPRLPLLLQLLLNDNVITIQQAEQALNIQKEEGKLIGLILVNNNSIDEITLVEYLQREYPKASLKKRSFIEKLPWLHQRSWE